MMKRKLQPPIRSSSDSGFTIIESLMGIVVVAILLASIAPVLVMSTAIRVQSRRIEKATQAANTFVDGVKTGSIEAPSIKFELDPPTKEVPRDLADSLIDTDKMPIPVSKTDPKVNLYFLKTDGTICLVSNEKCKTESTNPFEEFYIQAAQIIVKDSNPNDGYRLGLRVYRGDVDFSKTLKASKDDIKTVESPITGTLGNKQAPAVERTVDIGNRNTTFQALCSRLGMVVINKEDGTKEYQPCQ
ncbi:type II secretion system protein [Anabaena sp. UHCC 0253]|uniref:hormogonium polysaccharide secretion pseudopilin HpsB n=1 Tax=Anabaena sp. UHCC 0253 TaxID=2590019 RepID=UPI001447C72C|nr:hormogonium polysaccharide secretion pseudopilin HpsB [Anabaena sp. UHCC 0253]MTJ54390.1 type II secretion system protein [Anabaena sp. UHCC 0253]